MSSTETADIRTPETPLRLTIGLLTTTLIMGAVLTWWLVGRADREMRASLLQDARLVAQAANVSDVQALTGTAADLNSPTYLRLKEQLAAVRSTIPLCRLVYLLGRKENDSIFFFLDGEPAGSNTCVQPGEEYTGAPQGCRNVFVRRTTAVEGPYTDKSGAWISVLIPLIDPQTAKYGLATPEDAQAMVRKAVTFYHQHGRDQLLIEINKPGGEFHHGDLYAFAYDRSMTCLAHPVKPELVGHNQIDIKDTPGGTYFRRKIQEVARSKGSGWVEFEYENPLGKQPDHKTTFVEGVDDLIICAGAYSGAGQVVATLGMNIDANARSRKLAQAATPALLLTIAFAAIILAGSAQPKRGLDGGDKSSARQRRRREPALATASGLMLTLFAAWMVHEREIHHRADAFAQLASSWTDAIAETFRDLRDIELEGLARFIDHNSSITAYEFYRYTLYLKKDPAVQAWEWVPAVSAEEKSHFEAMARADGMDGFEIWQRDSHGARVPAFGRSVYYPVFYISPIAGNERALGYDPSSEAQRKAALETAARTGLATATDPITLVQESGSQKGMVFYRPVFDENTPQRLRGFAVAVLRMGAMLGTSIPDETAIMELSLLRKDGPPVLLARNWNPSRPPDSSLSRTRAIFAFGKVFSVTAHEGPQFRSLHPVRSGALAALAGLALTAAFSMVISHMLRDRDELEQMVSDRTAELRESEQAYYNQFARNSSVMLLIDPTDGAIIDANAAATNYYGYSHEQFRSMHISDVNVLPEVEILHAIATVRQDQANQFEFRHRLANGAIRDVTVSSSYIQSGKRPILHSIIFDVTEQRKSEAELRKLWRAVEQSPAAVVITNVNGTIEYVNPAFVTMTGYSIDDALGQNPRMLQSGEHSIGFYKTLWRTLLKGNVWQGELRNKRKTGELYWESASISPIRDSHGEITHFIAIKEDITERKRVTEELLHAKELAESANRAKSEFLATMSHEIRTPMNGLLGFTHLLLDTQPSPQQRQFIETIQLSGQRLLALINDILDFSKIEAGQLTIEAARYRLPQVVREVIELLKPQANQKQLALDALCDSAIPEVLIGDPARVRQVLLNLAGNALKFTQHGGVTITVRNSNPSGVIRFEVVDTGIGIPLDKQSLLFKKFSQVDSSTTRRFGGTGLGLAISKRLIELMGGEIGLISEPGKGSTFWFSLPATIDLPGQTYQSETTPTSDKIVPVAPPHPQFQTSLRVLLAEDDTTNQQLATHFLQKLGCQVDLAFNGAEAVALAAQNAYDVILMDCLMPEMDGWEATREIRRAPSRVPIIAVTASLIGDQRKKCLAAGMNDFIEKPVQFSALEQVLVKWSTNRSASQAAPAAGQLEETQPQVFNRDAFVARLLGDRRLAAKCAKAFLDDLPNKMNLIRMAAKASDPQRMMELAHQLKGSAATASAEALRALAAQLEQMAKSGDLEGPQQMLPQLEAQAALVTQAIESRLTAEQF